MGNRRKPVVAIIGKPNVGKSTLFNRIIGDKKAIVYDFPGVTRDRNYEDTSIYEIEITLVDTGGFDPLPGDPITDLTRSQVEVAIEEADLILFMVDGTQEISLSDYETLRLLRSGGKPFILVVNKIDSKKKEEEASFVYSLGIGETIFISALHGKGIGLLLDVVHSKLLEIVKGLPKEESKDEEKEFLKVSIIGRPNVGKSTLINKILGEERLLTSEVPGTTTDPIDVVVERGGKRYLFIDTAGVRRKKKVEEGLERVTVLRAIKAMERCDIVVMLIDSIEGPTKQDLKLVSLAIDRGKGVIVGVNKWDLVEKVEDASKLMEEELYERMAFARWIPYCFISGKTGLGLDRLFELIDKVGSERKKRVTTGKLNRFFHNIVRNNPPPIYKNKIVKMYYITQAEVSPPLFVIFVNDPEGIRETYKRFIVNKLRESFGFDGTPIRLIFKGKEKRIEEEREEV